MVAEGLYPEHDLFIQLKKLKNTLRHMKGEDLVTHLGLEYYDWKKYHLGLAQTFAWSYFKDAYYQLRFLSLATPDIAR